MRQFWCSALRLKHDYRGDMLAAHQGLGELQRSHFLRWLVLFRKTVDDCFMEAPAETIFDRALKTARNLESALSYSYLSELGAQPPAPLIVERTQLRVRSAERLI